MVLGLTALWVLLWGGFRLADVLTGILVGVAVCVVFPLPPIEARVRLRPLGIAAFAARFAVDMAVSSWRIGRHILTPGTPPCAVLAVRLRCPGDLLLTGTAIAVSAVPGSNVLDVHRESGTLYLHVIGAGGAGERERARQGVLRLEARVVRAFGTREDIAALEPAAGRGEEGAAGSGERGGDADPGASGGGDGSGRPEGE